MLTSVTRRFASELTKTQKNSTKLPTKEITIWLTVALKIEKYLKFCVLSTFATSAMQVTLQMERWSEGLKRKLHSPWMKVFRFVSIIIT